MEPSRQANNSLTPAQQQAVAARGNVLVMAGAGTGKTKTLIERCLDCIGKERAAIDEILVVTFTEAAAAEMKQRLRRVLEDKSRESPGDPFFAEQLALFDAAHIGTLHGFCFKLVREHFYELGLDPQPAVLDEGEARLLADEMLDEEFQQQYEGRDEFAVSFQKLIQTFGGARDEKIRSLVLRLHHYAQTRPDAEIWLAEQIEKFSANEPAEWQAWLAAAIADCRDEWLPVLENLGTPVFAPARRPKHVGPGAGAPPPNEKAAEIANILRRLPEKFSREAAAEVMGQIVSADGDWPAKRKGVLRKPLEELINEAKFLASVASIKNGNDPLAEDWNWVRGHMTTLLRLAQTFAGRFAERKRDDGVLDFHDLEQFALKLLWDSAADKPTATAERWREKLRFVFVDEYQDINAAQDKIIQALSRDGTEANRFLVGDVKQSIYRFRLADPKIFRNYAKSWRTIPLSENFRSREPLLNFVNSVFSLIMRGEIGGVDYDEGARLKFGLPAARAELSAAINPAPRAELLLRLKMKPNEVSDDENGDLADLEESAKEARLLALRLSKLKDSGHEIWDDKQKTFREVEWRDMAVLLRSPSGKAEIFAKEFERAGVQLSVARGGFYDTSEILDLLSILQLLDNPLQDVPGIAVLRSPLVGLSLDELAEIRLAAGGHFWFALNQAQNPKSKIQGRTRAKVANFLEQFHRWRKLARQVSLSQCLEEVLAETHYADWLLSRPRGQQRRANIEQFLNLAQRFDQFQRQGLFRFLKFIEAQREAGAEPEVAPVADENAVRLMSIHQSKGQEFPVVVIADLAKTFNEQDLREEIILDGEFGLCPRVQPPQTGARYPSLPHWLARRAQRRELRGEELRLLYVAMTRARDTLILSGGITENKWDEFWTKPATVTPQAILSAKCFADWLGLWFANQIQSPSAFAKLRRDEKSEVQGGTEGELTHLRWRVVTDAELADKTENEKQKTEMELHMLDERTKQKLQKMLEWQYEFDAATRRKAKSSVTELRRAAEETDDEAEPIFARPGFAVKNQKQKTGGGKRKLSAAEMGMAHHKFLQHFALGGLRNIPAFETEARRLEGEKILSADERAVLDLEALADFWDSPPGGKILSQSSDSVKRELPFTAKFSPAELAEITGASMEAGLENEFVVVQGVADLVVLLPREIWLVDFKTDQVRADELPAKTKLYSPQLKLYALALAKIYSRPVANCWLHFLNARRTVDVKI